MKKLYTTLLVFAFAMIADAQRLPKAVYTLDFEGAESVTDFGGIQHGDGIIVQSDDEHFGTYYQNNPNWTAYTLQTNFLEVPTNVLTKVLAKDTKSISIGFWVNATVGNQKEFTNYWGPLFNMYNETSCAGHTWPQALEVRYGGQIHGNANGTWYDNNHNTGTSADGTITYDDDFMKSIMQWSVQNEEKPDFADNWHYFTTVYTQMDGPTMNYKLYIDGELKIDCNEALSGDADIWAKLNALDRFCIGGNSFNWGDPDNVYAYDDIAFFADAITEEQIQLLIDLKMGNMTDEVKLALARSQLEDIMDEANDYAGVLSEAGLQKLADALGDYAMEIDPSSYETVEAVNAEIKNIQDMMEADAIVLEIFKAADEAIMNYKTYATSTNYAGVDNFINALDAATLAISDVESVEAIITAMATLEQAKVTYIFTQTGDVIDVTRVIDKPWFVKEAYEPTVTGDGIEFPAEAVANLNIGKWTMTASEELKGATDLNLYFTNGRTTANLFHSSNVANGVLDVKQTITDLPVGYYEVSADMCSTSASTNNHIYASSGEFTQVSSEAFGLPTPFNAEGKTAAQQALDWISLTANKVYVGEDGKLTIGATSTTDGTQYKGWFCVTNFQLKYYGTEYNLDEDVQEKQNEILALISNLKWKGDITNANDALNLIINLEESAYTKLSLMTDLESSINDWILEESAFDTPSKLKALVDEEDNATAKAIYSMGYDYMNGVIAGDDMMIAQIESLNALYAQYLQLAGNAISAIEWGTTGASAAASAVTSNLTGKEGDIEAVKAESEKLLEAMKSSITEFEASLESPKDITALIGNASFDNDLHDAWTIEGTPGFQQAEIEFYNNSFDLYQVITDLPKGTYKVTASGFYRDGNDYRAIVDNFWTPSAEDPEATIYDTHANMKLYAKVGSINLETAFVSIASDSLSFHAEDDDTYYDYYGNENHVSTDFTSNDKTVEPIVYYPYWMWNAYDMISNRGLYAGNEVVFVISEEKSDITIGASKATTIPNDWAIIDNFQLFYMGQDIPDAIEDISESANAEGSVPVAYYTISGAQAVNPQNGIYIVKYANGKVAKKFIK